VFRDRGADPYAALLARRDQRRQLLVRAAARRPRARPTRRGRSTGGSADQAVDAVRNLAGLHAPVWNDASLSDHREWLSTLTGKRGAFLGTIAVSAAEVFTTRYADELGDDVDTLRRSAELTGRWAAFDPGTSALVHGDYRLDNLMFPPTGARDAAGGGVATVDWQTLAIGPPARDLAYFLATSMHVDERRCAHERALVHEYVDALRALGVDDYSDDRCFADYRLGVLQGPMITMIGAAYATRGTVGERRRDVPRDGEACVGRAARPRLVRARRGDVALSGVTVRAHESTTAVTGCGA